MIRALVLVVIAASVAAEVATTKKAISAAVKDTSVNGVEGVNLVWNAPFKIDDYVVGFKYSIAKFGQAPDVVFARREFAIGSKGDQSVTVQADLDIGASSVAFEALYTNGKFDVSVEGNTVDRITAVGAATTVDIKGHKVDIEADYTISSQVIAAEAAYRIDDDTKARLKYNTDKKDAVVSLERAVSDVDTIIPSYAINSGSMKLGWLRKWTGGSLKTTLHPDDKVVLEWKDEGCNGVWTTTADVPINDRANTKISFSRDWNY